MKKIIILFILLALSLFAFNCGGGSGSSNSPKGENPGEPSIVQLLPSHFVAQTNSIITLHAKVLDGNGAPVNNIPVSFTNLSPIGILNSTTAQTNNTGIATVTLKSTTSGFSTVQVEVNKGVSQVRDRKTVFFSSLDTSQPIPRLDLTVDGAGQDNTLFEPNVSNDDEVLAIATVYDGFGQRVIGMDVLFGSDSEEATFPLGSLAMTDTDGQASVLVKVIPSALRDLPTVMNLTALADNGAFDIKTLTLYPVVIGEISVSANPQTIASGGTSTITAQVLTNAGTPAPDGTTVNFSVNPISRGSIEPFAQTIDGFAKAAFTAPSTAGTCTVTATAAGVWDTVDVTVTTALTVQPSTQTIDGTAGGAATFRIFGGIPSYSVFSNNPSFLPVPTTLSSSGGTFTVTVPAGTAAGTVTITARDSAGTTATATITITGVALAVLPSTITANEGEAIDYIIFGGVPPYDVFSSSTFALSAPTHITTEPYEFSVTIGDVCTPPITDPPTPTCTTSIGITVRDGRGSTATATLNVNGT